MLKNVFLHVDEDKEVQNAIEQQASPHILQLERKNLLAFQRFIPSVYEQIFKISNNGISILCNKHSEMNIIDTAEGRTFYGFNPKVEAAEQVTQFSQRALTFSVNPARDENIHEGNGISGINSPLARKLEQSGPASSHIPVLVVLGIGGAMHLSELVERFQIDHLVIYEPEPAYFKCSLAMSDWQHILTVAAEKSTAIYMMLGEDGSKLADNLAELSGVVNFDEFALFKHYNHATFDTLTRMLCEYSWPEFQRQVVKGQSIQRPEQFQVEFTYPINLEQWSTSHLDEAKFSRNLSAFKRLIPNLYQEFSDFTPDLWHPVANSDGQVNMLNAATLTPFYSDNPIAENKTNIDVFTRYPNNDGLVLNFTGKKLNKYLHYQMVEEVDNVLEQVEDEQRSLPQVVRSVILFGIGAGYGFEQLFTDFQLEKIFICEPNRDFFYTSLYAIDWHSILEKIEQQDGRIYLNIGDDGTHLIEDLLTQFHTVGPYVLASTFFYQGYYNKYLTPAVVQLREQLQVIVSLGDYFDHSKYCIAHTRWGMENGIPILKKDPQQYLSQSEKETPVFIVGNGPSLDSLIDIIQEYRDNAIIVSCGTALKTLYKHGITPDFHAEIESNRATFDWTVRVGDFDYLKKITLLSCNGIHPDTCALFKDVALAFKEGESATVAVTKLFEDFPYAKLFHAYPTVTNFVANFFVETGFSQLYLLGVDLGFVDIKHHHSKASGYYTDEGEELFDYAESINTSLRVEGNFRPFVETKYEFKLAKTLLEKVLVHAADVYNLNDGAKISGAIPLVKEHVLVMGDSSAKANALNNLKQKCFSKMPTQEFRTRFSSKFSRIHMLNEMQELISMVNEPADTIESAETFLHDQRHYLIGTYFKEQSLLFYYLNGSLNFISSAMMRAINIDNSERAISLFNQLLAIWKSYLEQFSFLLTEDEESFCFITFNEHDRRVKMLNHVLNKRQVKIEAVPAKHQPYVNDLMRLFNIGDFSAAHETLSLIWGNKSESQNNVENAFFIHTKQTEFLRDIASNRQSLLLPGDWKIPGDSASGHDYRRVNLAISAYSSNAKFVGFIGTLSVTDLSVIEKYFALDQFEAFYCYECGNNLIGLTKELLAPQEQLLIDGTRARLLPRKLKAKDLVLSYLSEQEMATSKDALEKKLNSIAVSHD